ncbi:aromatic-ring hydroxylase C-terminal domain-containing protein [Microbacterium caowuchunii]|uniref:aromatic-ring hydroxylase C-terminal domain-containing protein n=1 Tax=Microbacterium caowuchunii TaxID=2614638 RepID=UPI0037C6A282
MRRAGARTTSLPRYRSGARQPARHERRRRRQGSPPCPFQGSAAPGACHWAPCAEQNAGAPGVLLRPDGHVAWAGATQEGLERRLTRWFGRPSPAGT